MSNPVVGIQMYSLRDLTESDFLGTLKKVADIGYKAVEFAGFFNTPAKELKAYLSDLGLSAPSAHISLNFTNPDKLYSDLAVQLEYAQELGLTYIVTPWAPLPELPTMDDVRNLADIFNKASEQAAKAGLKYGYHNHDFEFKLVEGKPAIDHLLELVPAEQMMMEFDLGWVHVAGHSPADYLSKYAGRVQLAHYKDFTDGRKDTEIGNGLVGYAGLLDVTRASGVEYIFVEQEQYESTSIESAQISFEFFKQKGLV